MMNVGHVCEHRAVTVRATDDLVTAARLMREHHIGYLVVVEPAVREGEFAPVGVITDRDIVVSVVAREADPRSLLVGDVMTRKPCVVLLEDSIADALQQMNRIGVRRLPVVGAYGTLAGVLSLDDILTRLAGEMGSVAGALGKERTVEGALRP